MKRTGFKKKPRVWARKPSGSRKKGLRKMGKSPLSVVKAQIQAKLRERVIARDGGCILRHYPEAGDCGGFRNDGDLILQAEHLNGRANSVSYAELENIVCLCQYHHIFYKKQNNARYWVLIRRHVGEDRWRKIEGWIMDRTAHHVTTGEWRAKLSELSPGK